MTNAAIGETNSLITEYFASIARYAADQARVLSLVGHHGTHGTLNELFLRDFLCSLVPEPYGAVNGIVVDSYGNQSNQTDVILYDGRIAQPFVRTTDVALCAYESVLATIEVRSTIDEPKDFSEASEGVLTAFQRMIPSAVLPFSIRQPAHYFFAFARRNNDTCNSLLGVNQSGQWFAEKAPGLSGACILGVASWMRQGKRWPLKEYSTEQPFAETARFFAIALDNLRFEGATRWGAFSTFYTDLLGAYIRPRPH